MRNRMIGFVLLVAPSLVAGGEHWPQFRGPDGSGHADVTGLPLSWTQRKNVVWQTTIHDRGWSSPVVRGQQVWVTTAAEDGKQLFAVCVDRGSGKILHDVKVFVVEQPQHVASINSYASPTPVIERGRIYVHYGTYGTACLDTMTGKVLWTRRDLNCDHHEGPGASPILFGELLIFHVDGRDVQYVVALDKATGKTLWKTNRSIDFSRYNRNFRKAFCTPIVIRSGGREQLISPGAKGVMAYEPHSGQELWRVRYSGWSVTPRPLFGHGLSFVVVDYVRPELWAIRPDGRGDVTDTHVVWKLRKGIPAKSSLLLVGDLLYMVSDSGLASCVEAKTGQLVWKARLGGNFAASPIYADGRIHFFSQEGVTTVIRPGRRYQPLATSELDEQLMASPAVAGKSFFVRTRTRLYRIEQRR